MSVCFKGNLQGLLWSDEADHPFSHLVISLLSQSQRFQKRIYIISFSKYILSSI